MRPIARRVLVTYVVALVATVGSLVLAVKVSGAFIAGFMFAVMFGFIGVVSIACPKCGQSVLLGDRRMMYTPLILFPVPKKCRKCGHKL